MINKLKETIIIKVGKNIENRGDCEYLSEMIEIETGKYINYNTLRRFFNIDKKKVKPNINTLNILSIYVGYNSFNHFTSFKPHEKLFDDKLQLFQLIHEFNEDDITEYYLKINDRFKKIDFLIILCRHAILKKEFTICSILNNLKIKLNDFSYDELLVIGNSVGLAFRKNKFDKNELKFFLENQFFNEFIFEIFVDYSSLNGYYSKYIKSKSIYESQKIFKICLNILRDYLNLKNTKLVVETDFINTSNNLHPILLGRLLSINLYYNKYPQNYLKSVKDLSMENLYEPIVASILTSNFTLYLYIRRKFSKYLNSEEYRHLHYFQVYFLMITCYLYKSGNLDEALNKFRDIEIKYIRFSYKDILSFFYFILGFKLKGDIILKNKAIKLSEKLNYPRYNLRFIEEY